MAADAVAFLPVSPRRVLEPLVREPRDTDDIGPEVLAELREWGMVMPCPLELTGMGARYATSGSFGQPRFDQREPRRALPYSFGGYSTNFSEPDPNSGVQHLQPIESGPVNHRVEILAVRGFFLDYLGVDPNAPLAPADWLTLPQQGLRAAVGGAVYHDEVGLDAASEHLPWCPHEVWLYLMAAGWARIGQEEHLMGRAGLAGYEVGSALLGARLVRDAMRLCFSMERTYAPYPKWFGAAFRQLSCGPDLIPALEGALHAAAWTDRERHLVVAYETLGRMHNQLGFTDPMPEQARSFFDRPFRVMALHGFADELLREITDARVRLIADRPPIGNIDMLSDNSDLLDSTCGVQS